MLGMFCVTMALWGAPAIKVAPAGLTYSFVQGTGASTAVQTISVAAVANGQVIPFVISTPWSQWLTVTPGNGRTTLVVRVFVNSTSLLPGTYSERLTIVPTEGTNLEPVVVPITLTITAPPSDVVLAPTTLEFVSRLGYDTDGISQPFYLGTGGGLQSFSLSTKGTDWLTANPTTGNVFPGFRTSLQAIANPSGLAPGTYKGSITINVPTAVTKTTTLNVTLTVEPGEPEVTSVWPASLPAQSPTSILTVRGARFFPATVARIHGVAVTTRVLGDRLLEITVPAAMMTVSRVLPIAVTNPGAGGGTATAGLVVTMAGPIIRGIGNAASQQPAAAPGSLLVLYGQGLGPDILASFDPWLTRLPMELGGVTVSFQGEPAPVLYAGKDQICVTVPYGLEPNRPYMIQASVGGLRSNPWPVLITATAPGLFTTSGTGADAVAAYGFDEVKGEYFLVSDTAPALRGGFVVMYGTGEGRPPFPLVPEGLDGLIADRPSPQNSLVSITMGGAAAEVLYAGTSPGLVVGIMQITVKIPMSVVPGKSVPLGIRIGNLTGPAGPTMNIK